MTRMMRIAVLAALCTPVLGWADQVKVTEQDYATYQKLREANAYAQAKKSSTYKADEKKAAEAQFDAAVKAAGWSRSKFEDVDSSLNSVLQAVKQTESADADERENGKLNLEDVDAATIATVKAHRKDLEDTVALDERMRKKVADEKAQAQKGTPPTASELQGTWVLDLAASVENMAGSLDEATKKKMVADMRKSTGESKYIFKGNQVESRVQQAGKKEQVSKGTFRVEGNTLYVGDNRKREQTMTVGMRGSDLIISMMGAGLVFKKK